MTLLVVLTVLEIVLLIAGLAVYLFWVGTLLNRIAANLEQCSELVREIVAHAALIRPNVEHINQTGGVVAGACRCCTRWARRSSPGPPGHRKTPPRCASRPGRPPGPAARACTTRSVTPRPTKAPSVSLDSRGDNPVEIGTLGGQPSRL